ncbi:MAG: precorrin-6A reductase [Bacillota bacterium]|nr:precorrin-6A reductase [Bacillota bacterium]
MYNICVFAGTTEGRELVEFLSSQPILVTACVATEYGGTLLPAAEKLRILTGRLSEAEIIQLLSKTAFDLLIDATHPYAASVTENLFSACQATGTEYLRLLRKASDRTSDVVSVSDPEAALAFLETTEGNILLACGSKEIEKFSRLSGFSERVYARVLPAESSLAACRAAGLKASHIIAMQGPFSEEMNLAMLHAVSASWLVTKDGGDVGGFEAKISAAEKAKARLVVIGRPAQKEGLSFSAVMALLCRRFGCNRKPQVDVLGIGPGNRETMTEEVRQAIKGADCLIGAKRMLEAVASPVQQVYEAISPEDIAEYILRHHEHQRFAVVMSGDVGFFSGAKKLLPLLAFCEVKLLPGLSSLAYLCARLKTSYEDVFCTSLHGRQRNIVLDIRSHSRVFALLGGENAVQELCRSLAEAGLGKVRISIGEQLSYPDEKITQGKAEDLANGIYGALSVALIENEHPDAIVTHGLPDAMFLRGAGSVAVIPMTKSEIRSVCLSKLQLREDSVCWDVGAGTGSVAIEMALQAKKGQVYAIERNSAALALLQLNKEKFAAENLSVVSGCAPEACLSLPAPSHAFIGGSSGNMREILAVLLEKNPCIRVVATAISLESVADLTACMKAFPWNNTEVVSLQLAYDKKAGAYHLMSGRNPVYIFTMQAGEEKG